jgi:hypothetical protein
MLTRSPPDGCKNHAIRVRFVRGKRCLPAASGAEPASADVSKWSERCSATLATAGVVPAQTLGVSGATFHLSPPYALDESHQVAVAWIDIAGERAVRILYRSNSQCCWRLCDAITPSHLGKGFHEFDKQLPIDVTVALLRAGEKVGELRPWFHTDAEPSQEMLSGKLLELLTADRDEGLKSGEVVTVGNTYVTKEYASLMPVLPRPFSKVTGHIKTAAGSSVADPAATSLPHDDELPDFARPIESVQFEIPSYARFAGGSGNLTGRVYLSHDRKLKYFFVEDSSGRAMLSCVELMTAPLCSLGLRTQYVDVEGMDAPLLEYAAQIPEIYGGHRKARYQSNWNWVRRLPIIQYYYRQTGRAMPAIDEARQMPTQAP